ncbi:2751_t:CDS:2 [Funneliformis geosporum]|uniref:18135_t:CDS:1 n=1 Tax=Funneliformis geosporum TaxID=1117311 RepID=A0A9W4SJN4_9GLOM|nr:2751_t:CDS:2 [Funneliformis geosporum]CAI2172373.1 18135_t:CDS:2 [Funneliformis geosporum]
MKTRTPNKVNMKEQNTTWMLNSPNPSPLCFFRFTFSMNRSRAFDTYVKALELAFGKCKDETVKERLLKMREKSNDEIQTDWEVWLEERKTILLSRSIQDTNIAVQNRLNTRVENQGTLLTTPTTFNKPNKLTIDIYDDDENDVENFEDKRDLLISSTVITDPNEEVLESLATLFESSQEDLILSIAEESLDREEIVIPDVTKQFLKENKLVLSSQLDVCAYFRNMRLKIPLKNKILNPAYYGIIDLTGQHIETKTSFAVEDWEELRNIFGTIVRWQYILTPEHFTEYFDKNFTLPSNPKDELRTFHKAVEFLRTSYPIQNTMSEQHATHALYYPLISTVLRNDAISLLDWGEIISCSSSDAKNDIISPEKKAKIGHKVDLKITLKTPNYKLQAVHGEISGGIKNGKAEACKRKQWLDKLKLMIMMRDELNQIIKYYTQSNADFLYFIVYGIQVIGFQLNVYAMTWCSGGVYLFGLVDKCLIPGDLETFYSLEEVYVILKTLQMKVKETSNVLIFIEQKHAKKRRRPLAPFDKKQCDLENDLVLTRTPKHRRTLQCSM